MGNYVIDGGYPLTGNLRVHGSKNAVLPMLAACILNNGISVIENVPRIRDVYSMMDILKALGCKCTFSDGVLVTDSAKLDRFMIEREPASRVRTSVLFCGSLLARFGRARVAQPGGCAIGNRPVDIHLDAFQKMGASVKQEAGMLELSAAELHGIEYNMPFPSVGATQNIMMAALNSEGITVIRNAAKEPEIREFACFLRSMGASVEGDGTDRIMIQGKEELHDTVYTLGGDRIVAGTYMAACAAAGGAIRLEGIHADACHGFLEVFEQMGCSLTCGEGFVEMQKNERLRMPACITTEPYPGFPTDMQPQLMSLMCMADGNGVIRENIFENRLRNAAELVKTGADIRVEENTAYIRGVERLHGAKMISYDLRGGAALIVAGLAAKGQTVVEDKGYIDRGYEDIRRDLCLLGAHII